MEKPPARGVFCITTERAKAVSRNMFHPAQLKTYPEIANWRPTSAKGGCGIIPNKELNKESRLDEPRPPESDFCIQKNKRTWQNIQDMNLHHLC